VKFSFDNVTFKSLTFLSFIRGNLFKRRFFNLDKLCKFFEFFFSFLFVLVSVVIETYDFYIFPEQEAITDIYSISIYFSLLLLFVGFSSFFHSYSIIISRLCM
jgi:hypothetical protein